MLDSGGTAQSILWIRDRYDPSPEVYRLGYSTYHHVVPDSFVLQGGLDSGGGFLDWSARLLGLEPAEERVAQLVSLAAQSVPGANGVVALPFLLGKGAPHRQPAARGLIGGLRMSHCRADIARACVEALAFWLRDNLDAMHALLGREPAEIIGAGGVNRSPLLCQIKADVAGLPFTVPQIEEGAALGAALLAGLGVGLFPSAEAARASVRAGVSRYLPDAGRHAAYDRHYREEYQPLLLRNFPSA